MKALLIPLVLLALSVPALAATTPSPVYRAPGPLIGAGLAGLPVLLIGGGIYWIVRRKKVRPS